MRDLLKAAAMANAVALCGLEQIPVQHRANERLDLPKNTKNRAKVKAARKQKHRSRR